MYLVHIQKNSFMNYQLSNHKPLVTFKSSTLEEIPIPQGYRPLAFFKALGLEIEDLRKYLPYYEVLEVDSRRVIETYFLNPGLKPTDRNLRIEGAMFEFFLNGSSQLRTNAWQQARDSVGSGFSTEFEINVWAGVHGGAYIMRQRFEFDEDSQHHVSIEGTIRISGVDYHVQYVYFHHYQVTPC